MLVSLNGDTYHGEFRDGKPNGYGEMRYAFIWAGWQQSADCAQGQAARELQREAAARGVPRCGDRKGQGRARPPTAVISATGCGARLPVRERARCRPRGWGGRRPAPSQQLSAWTLPREKSVTASTRRTWPPLQYKIILANRIVEELRISSVTLLRARGGYRGGPIFQAWSFRLALFDCPCRPFDYFVKTCPRGNLPGILGWAATALWLSLWQT